jgi:hypothetical protein
MALVSSGWGEARALPYAHNCSAEHYGGGRVVDYTIVLQNTYCREGG